MIFNFKRNVHSERNIVCALRIKKYIHFEKFAAYGSLTQHS